MSIKKLKAITPRIILQKKKNGKNPNVNNCFFKDKQTKWQEDKCKKEYESTRSMKIQI